MDNFTKKYYCPICNKDDSAEVVNYNVENNKYINQLLIKYSINLEKLQNHIELSKCNKCSVYFFNKWFKKSIAIDLFTSLRHKQGWQNYIENSN